MTMDFNDAQTQMAQGSKVKRVAWPIERFVVIGDPVSEEDQQALDWVESSFVEQPIIETAQESEITQQPMQEPQQIDIVNTVTESAPIPEPPTPNPTALGANTMQLQVKEIKQLNIVAKVKGQEVEIDRLLEVKISAPGAEPVYNANGKEASVEGTEVATGLTALVTAIVVVEGKKVELTGETQPFDVVAEAAAVDAEGNPVPDMALTAELAE